MKLKLLKAHKLPGQDSELAQDSIVETDELGAKALLLDGVAVEYTAQVEADERLLAVKTLKDAELAQKSIHIRRTPMAEQIVAPTDAIKRLRDEENLIGKAFQSAMIAEVGGVERLEQKLGRKCFLSDLATKAVVGMSEGTAADGGNIVTEGVTRLMGLVYAESEFLNETTKLNMGEQQNAMKVVYETSDWYTAGTAPIATIATEGAAMTPTKLSLGAVDVYPRVPNILIAVTAELLEDVAGLEGEIVRMAKMKLPKVIEGLAFFGTGANGAQGFSGINDASSSGQVATQTIASIAAPTLAELQGFCNKIVPALRKRSAWYMSNAMWTTIQGSSVVVSAANIGLQLIDLKTQTLLGYPVRIIETIPASAPIFFGCADQYVLVNGRLGEQLFFSREAYFTSNQLAWRLTRRVGGCVGHAKYTLSDSSTVAAFCKVSVQGS